MHFHLICDIIWQVWLLAKAHLWRRTQLWASAWVVMCQAQNVL